MEGRKTKRILLLDDHSVLRQGLREIIDREPDLKVCGEAGDARTGMAMVKKTKPDLILVDISLPGPSGIEFLKDLKSIHPEISTAVLSMHDENLFAERALRAGALAYIPKKVNAAELLKGIRCALEGNIHVSQNLEAKIFNKYFNNNRKREPILAGLSDRELEVFELLGHGFSRTEIACRLNVSTKTIDTHKDHIKRKLDLNSSGDLNRQAINWVAEGDLDASWKTELQT